MRCAAFVLSEPCVVVSISASQRKSNRLQTSSKIKVIDYFFICRRFDHNFETREIVLFLYRRSAEKLRPAARRSDLFWPLAKLTGSGDTGRSKALPPERLITDKSGQNRRRQRITFGELPQGGVIFPDSIQHVFYRFCVMVCRELKGSFPNACAFNRAFSSAISAFSQTFTTISLE